MQTTDRLSTSILARFSTYVRTYAHARSGKGKSETLQPADLASAEQILKELVIVVEKKQFSLTRPTVELARELGEQFGASAAAQSAVYEFLTQNNLSQTNLLLISYILALTADGCSHSTVKNYRSDIGQFFAFANEKTPSKMFTKPKVQGFLREQQAKGLAAASIKRKLVSLTQMAIWLEIEGIMPPRSLSWLMSMSENGASNAQAATVAPLVDLTNERRTNGRNAQIRGAKSPNWKAFVFGADATAALPQERTNSKTPKNSGALQTQDQRFHLKRSLYNLRSGLQMQSQRHLLPYLNLMLSLILFLGMGYFGYLQIFGDVEQPLAYPSTLTRPNRTLSFQGRLTDTNQNPIITSTNLRFRLYDSGPSTSGGNLLWDSNTCAVTPDQDGIFAVGLGEDCGSEIGNEVFSENSNVWLQVQVASEILSPRQSIKSVAYALNSETLQGYPASASATENTVLVMNNDGDVVLGSASPVLKSTSGTFGIEAQTLLLSTSTGSNGDITLSPDGSGKINLLSDVNVDGYIHAPGSTLSATYAGGTALTLRGGPSATADIMRWTNSAGTSLGVIDENGNVGIGTSNPDSNYRLDVAGRGRFTTLVTINQNSQSPSDGLKINATGSSASIYGSTSGNFFFDGNSSQVNFRNTDTYGYLDFSTARALTFNSTTSTDAGMRFRINGSERFRIHETGNVGIGSTTPSQKLDVVGAIRLGAAGANNVLNTSAAGGAPGTNLFWGNRTVCDSSGSCGGAFANYWRLENGAFSPVNDTADLLIGASATSSAKFAFINVNSGTPTASIAGNLAIASPTGANPTTSYDILNGGSFNLRTSVGGDAGLTSRLFVANSGNVGIGTSNPTAKLHVVDNSASTYFSVQPTLNDAQMYFGGSANTNMSLHNTNGGNFVNFYSSGTRYGYVGLDSSDNFQFVGVGAPMIIGYRYNTGPVFQFYNVRDANTPAYFSINQGGYGLAKVFQTYSYADPSGYPNQNTHITFNTTETSANTNAVLVVDQGNVDSGSNTRPSALFAQRVGIGTTGVAPTTMLDIKGLSGYDLLDVALTGGTSAIRIVENGNLGIGTTSPGSKLDVAGYIKAPGATLSATYASGTALTLNAGPSATADIMRWNSSTGTQLGVIDENGNIGIGIANPNYSLSTNGTLALQNNSGNLIRSLNTNDTGYVALSIQALSTNFSAGNVGIGSTSPSQKLDVVGAIRLGAAGANNILNTSAAGGAPSGNLFWGNRTVCDSSGSCGGAFANYWRLENGAFSPVNDTADLLIGASATSSAKFAFINVNSGAPTASIAGNLAIASPTGANPTTSYDILNGGSFNLRTSVGGDAGLTSRLFVSNSGNVGIGTTAPETKFYVSGGNIAIDNNSQLQQKDASGTLRTLMYFNSSDVLNINNNTGGDGGSIVFNNGSGATENVRILSDGNVGIGTTSPVSKLNVGGAGSLISFTGTNGGGGEGISYTDSGGTLRYSIMYPGSDIVTVVNRAANGVVQIRANTSTAGSGGEITVAQFEDNEINFLASGGNVGIGNSTPSFNLDVSGTGRFTGALTLNTLAAGATDTVITHASGVLQQRTIDTRVWGSSLVDGSGTANRVAYWTDGETIAADDDFFFNGTNVGIGTTSTPAKLSVVGTSRFEGVASFRNDDGVSSGHHLIAEFYRTDPGSGNAGFSAGYYANGSDVAYTLLYAPGARDFALTTYSGGTGVTNPNLYIKEGGNIGIGSTSPSQKLDVVGAIRLGAAGANNVLNTSAAGGAPGTNLFWGNRTVCDSSGSCGGAFANYWRLENGAFSPVNDTADLLIGASATSSAKFAFINVNSGTPTASIAGNLAIASPTGANPTTSYDILNGGSFNLRTSVGGDAGLTSRLFVANNGNVGIGTISPSEKLQVNGNIRFGSTSNQLIFDSASGHYITDSSNTLRFATAFNDRLLISNGGSITANMAAGANFDLYDSSGAPNWSFRMRNNPGVSRVQFSPFVTDGASAVAHFFDTNNALTTSGAKILSLRNLGVENAFIDKDGGAYFGSNLGIGTTSPGTKLDVAGYIKAPGATLSATYAGGTALTLNAGPSATTDIMRWNSSTGTQLGVIDENGNIGIGTSNPTQKLTISGNANFTTGGLFDSETTIGAGQNDLTITSPDYLEMRGGFSTRLGVGSTNYVFIDSSGRTGFGTSWASANTVNVNGNMSVGYNNTAAPSNGMIVSGNVGLGSTSPSQKLDVVGAIRLGAAGANNVLNTSAAGGAPGTNLFWGNRTVCDSSGSCGGAFANYWRLENGAFSPVNDTADLLIGASATSSAKFAFINVNSGTPTASISGSSTGNALSLTGDGTIATSLNRSLLLNPNGGRVGIGTTGPAYNLDVTGTGRFTSNLIANTTFMGVGGNGGAYAHFSHSSMTGSGQYALLQSSTGTTYLNSATGNNIHFRVNNQDQMILQSNGNLGIGTTAAAASKLDIDTGSNTLGLRLRGLAETTEIADMYVAADGSFVMSTVGGSDTSQFIDLRPEDDQYGLVLRESDGTGTAAYANFYVADAASDYLSINVGAATTNGALNIAASNNIGIGTSAPAYKLDVAGTGRFTGALELDSTLLDVNNQAGSSGQLLSSTGTGVDWIDPASVGTNYWGLTSNVLHPLDELADVADLVIGGNSTASADFRVTGLGAGSDLAGYTYGRRFIDIDSQNYYVEPGNTTTSALFAGNVGIGTTGPSSLFQVGSATAGNFRVDSDGAIGHYYQAESVARVGLGRDMITSGGYTAFSMDGSAYATQGSAVSIPAARTLGFYTSNGTALTERMRIDSAGNVGIGTTTTTSWKTAIRGGALSVGTSDSQVAYLGADGSNVGYVGTSTNHPFQIRTNSSTRMTILTDGNVGIGTTTPAYKLDVAGTSRLSSSAALQSSLADSFNNPSVIFDNTANPNVGLRAGNFTGYVPYLQAASAASTAQNLLINPFGGSVGIGTTSPTYKLDVAGTGYFGSKLSINNSALGSNSLDVYTGSSGGIATFQSNGATNGDNLVASINGGTVTGSVTGFLASLNSTINGYITVQQNGSGNAVMRSLVLGDGDASSLYSINGGQGWSVGLDNSDSDKFKISGTGGLGTSDYLTIQTNGSVGIGTTNPLAALDVSGDIYLTSGLSTFRTAVSDGTVEATQFCTGDGETNCVTDFSSISAGSSIWANTLNVIHPQGALATVSDLVIGGSSTASADFRVTGLGSGSDLAGYTYGRRFIDIDSTGYYVEPGNTTTAGLFAGNVGIGTTSPGTSLNVGTHLTNNVLSVATFNGNILAGTSTSAVMVGYGGNDIQGRSGAGLTANGDLLLNRYGGNVGIGTTTPTAKLDIAGSASTSGTLAFRGTTDPKIDILNGEAFGIRTSVGGDAGLTERFTVLNNGNVGIGTTVPDGKLHVSASDTSNTASALANTLTIESTGGNMGLSLLSAAGANGNIFFGDPADNDVGRIVYDHTNDSLDFHVNAGERATINSNGNLGIGTTSPGAKLAVGGGNILLDNTQNIQFRSSGTVPTNVLGLDSGNNLNINRNTLGGQIQSFGTFQFYNQTISAIRMTVLDTGNVGIGDSSPTYLLDVNGTGRFTGALELDSTLVDINGQAGTSGQLLSSTGSGVDWIDPASVGTNYWGLTSNVLHPIDALAEVADLVIGGSSTASADFRVTGLGSGSDLAGYTYGRRFIDIDSQSYYVEPGNTTTAAILAGNVGIGTTATSNKLQVEGTLGRTYIPTAGANLYIARDSFATVEIEAASTGLVGTTTNHGLSLQTNDTERVRIDTAGNVGIGTTTPTAQLHVVDTSDAGAATGLRLQSSATDATVKLARIKAGHYTNAEEPIMMMIARSDATTNELYIGGGYTSAENSMTSLRFYTGATNTTLANAAVERLTILNSGNVGIGFTAPAARLDIDTGSNTLGLRLRGTDETVEIADMFVSSTGSLVLSTINGTDSQAYIDLRPEDDQFGLILRESDGTGTATFANFYVTDAADDYLSINLNTATSGNALNITAGNNVGIGTTSTTYKLDVNGTGRFVNALKLDSTLLDVNNQAGSSGQLLSSTGTGVDWIDPASVGTNYWGLTSNVLHPLDALADVADLVIGGNSTASADFRVTGLGAGTDLAGYTYGRRFIDIDSQSYYVEPGNTTTSALFAGNVGIGTTSPVNKLAIISGDDKDTGPIIRLAGAAVNQTESGRIRFTEDSSNYQGGYISYDGSANVFNIGVHDSGDQLTANDINAISIVRSTNLVGIGETAPGSKLAVSGNATIGTGYDTTAAPTNGLLVEGNVGIGNSAPGSYKLNVSGNTNITGNLDVSSGVDVAGADITAATGVQIDFADEVGDKAYWYTNTYGTGIESSTLTNWSSSVFRWRVGGTSVSSGTAELELNASALYPASNGGLDLGTTSLRFANGYFGTSVNAPLLTYAGTLDIAATGANPIEFNTNGALEWSILSGGELEGNGASTIRTSTGNLTLATNGGNGHILLSPNGTGNVGIGTTSPGAKLAVSADNANTNFTIQNTSGTISILDSTTPSAVGTGGTIVFGSTYYTAGNTVGAAAIGSYKESAPSNGTDEYNHALVFKTGRHSEGILEKMRITSTGSVGIGTTNPLASLDVTGDIYLTSGLSTFRTAVSDGTVEATQFCTGDGETNCVSDFSSISAGSSIWANTLNVIHPQGALATISDLVIGGNSTASADFRVTGLGAGSDLAGYTYGRRFIDIDDTSYYVEPGNTGTSGLFAGSVGIGTTVPSDVLHIRKANQPTIRIESTGVDYDNQVRFITTSRDWSIGQNIGNFGSGKFSIKDNTSAINRLVIDTAGNVGIGTTTPNDVLDVAGVIDTSSYYKLGDAKILDVENTGSLLIGHSAGASIQAGANYNSIIGTQAGFSLTTGDSNVFLGENAGYYQTTAVQNVAIGSYAGYNRGSGQNVFIGANAGYGVTDNTGYNNVAIGQDALPDIDSGAFNVAIGSSAGDGVGTGGRNTFIGAFADAASTGISNSIGIGYNADVTASNQLVVGGSTSGDQVTDAYFGSGVVDATPFDFTLNATGGSGTDIAGADFILAGGKGTGNAAGGSIVFSTSDAGATGTTLQSLSTKMIILAGGNVGIGTTNPSAFKLQVNGNVGAQTNNTSTLGSTGVRWANVYSVLGNYSGLLTTTGISNSTTAITNSASYTQSGTSANTFTGATTISATGNALTLSGAATTALTISGAATTGINLSNTGITTDINLQNSETIDNNTDGRITFTGDIFTTGNTYFANGTTYYVNTSGHANLNNITGAGTLDINGAGTHDIAGTLNLSGSALTTSSTTFALLNTTATTINFAGAASTLNIGPGSSTATSVNLAGGSGATGCTVDGATGNFSCTGNITGANTGLWQYANGAISPGTPYTNNSDLLVGGDATASAKFAVLNVFPGTAAAPSASVSSGLSGTSMFMTADGTLATTRRQSLTIGNSSTYNTTGTVLINPNGTGNVGIGTTSSNTAKLTVAGDVTIKPTSEFGSLSVLDNDSTNNRVIIGLNSGNARISLTPETGSAIILDSAGNSYFPTGNFGIGTTNPSAFKLQVNGNVGPQTSNASDLGTTGTRWRTGYFATSVNVPLLTYSGTLDISATGANPIEFNTNGALEWSILSGGELEGTGASTIRTSTGNLTLATNAGNGHIILSPNGTGNVGIGTTTPGAKLVVAGNSDAIQFIIKANGTQSNSNPLMEFQKSDGTELIGIHSDHSSNLFIGRNPGASNTVTGIGSEGLSNTFVGSNAGYYNTTGEMNTALGSDALGSAASDHTGIANVALGSGSLWQNESGNYNTAVGTGTLSSNTTGLYNVAVGFRALEGNSTGVSNIVLGAYAGGTTGSFSRNIILGELAGSNLANGADNNILIGDHAGDNITTGTTNIVLGYDIDAPSSTSTNTMTLGNLIYGTGLTSTGTTISSGSVGIGTSSPSQRLHVSGNMRLTGALYDVNNEAGSSGQILSSTGSGVDWIDPSTLGTNYWSKVAGVLSPTLAEPMAATSAATTVATFTANGSNLALRAGGTTNFVTIDASGNITSPGSITLGGDAAISRGAANRFDIATGDSLNLVSGNLQIAGTTAIDTSRNANFATSVTLGGDVVVSRGAANRFDLASGDSLNVVSGSVQVGATDVITSGRLILGANGTAGAPTFSFSGDSNNGMYLGGTDILRFSTAGSDRLTILANGNVGIGSTTPYAPLQVNANSAGLAMITAPGSGGDSVARLMRTGTSDYATFEFANGTPASPTARWGVGLRETGDDFLHFYSHGLGADAMVIDNSSGNVGIGTTNPSSFKLQVAGSIGPQADSSYNLGSASLAWANVYADAFTQNGNAVCDISGNCTTSGLWANTSNVFHPRNEFAEVIDLVIGGTSTASADIRLSSNGTGYFGGNVGVGIATPAEKLAINSGFGLSGLGVYYDSANYGIRSILTHGGNSGGNNSEGGLQIVAQGTNQSTAGSGNIKFFTPTGDSAGANTDAALAVRMTILQGGNVGIGTTNPSSFKLQVAGHVGPQADDTYDLGSDTLRWRDLYLGGETLHIGASTADEGLISYTAGNILSFDTDSTTNGDIAFFTDDLYLDKSSGFVGIGTTAPTQTLQIASTANAVTAHFGIPAGSAVGSWNGIGIGAGNGATNQKVGILYEKTDTFERGSFHIATNNTGDTSNISLTDARLTVTAAGSVGIGTTVPAHFLDVQGSIRATGYVQAERSDPLYRLTETDAAVDQQIAEFRQQGAVLYGRFVNDAYSANESWLQVYRDTATYTVDKVTFPNGNIGIGTTTPNALLHLQNAGAGVTEALHLSNNRGLGNAVAGDGSQITFSIDSPSTADALFADISFIADDVISTKDSSITFSTYNANTYAEAMRIKSGNVGIGTTSPSSALHIERSNTTYNAATSLLRLTKRGDVNASNTDGAGARLEFASEDVDGNSMLVASIDGVLQDPDYNGGGRRGDLIFSTAPADFGSLTEQMRITSTGNVGIGTTIPVAKLQVGITDTSVYSATVNAGDGISVRNINNSGSSGIYSRLFLQTSSNNGTHNAIGMINLIQPTNASHDSNFSFQLRGSGGAYSEVMRILASGNVGIGETAPALKLEVKGAASAGGNGILIANTSTNGYSTLNFENSSGTTKSRIHSFNPSWSSSAEAWAANGMALANDDQGISLVADGASGVLRFYTAGNDQANERMRILANGNVGIGTTGPTAELHIGGTTPEIRIGDDGAENTQLTYMGNAVDFYIGLNDSFDTLQIGTGSTVGSGVMFGFTSSGTMGSTAIYNNTTASAANMHVASNGILYRSSSSIRYKTNVRSLNTENGLSLVSQLRPVLYNSLSKYDDHNQDFLGFIAEEIDSIGATTLVAYDEQGNPDGVNYDRITAVLVKAVQEQQSQIQSLASSTSNLTFSSSGELTLSGSNGNYTVTPAGGSPLTTIIGSAEAVIGKITAGLINTRELVVSNSAIIANLSVTSLRVSGQNISDYVRNIVQQELQTTSLPQDSLADNFTTNTLTVTDDATISGELAANTIQSESVVTDSLTSGTSLLGSLITGTATVSGDLTVEQNASVAGTLIAGAIESESSRFQTLEARMAELENIKAQTAELVDATVSGTLYADSIYNFDEKVADAFKKPTLLEMLTNTSPDEPEAASPASIYEPVEMAGYASVNPDLIATDSAILALDETDVVLGASALFVEKYLEVNGHAYVAQSLGIGNTLKIGNSLFITNGTIDYAPAGVEHPTLAIQSSGQGKLDLLAGAMTIENGLVAITGDLTVAGRVKADTLLTNLVQPADFGNPFQVQVAGVATESGEVKRTRFEIIDETGTAVATFDAEGNASFQGGISVANQDLANEIPENDTVITDKSSGQAKLSSGKAELKIQTPKATPSSLIYVTPKGSTDNKVLYIKDQVEGEFTVGFDQAIGNDVEFNWWIVN